MSISYPLTIPTATGYKNFKLSTMSVVGVGFSEYTLEQTVQDFSGQLWGMEFVLPSLTKEQSITWQVFLQKLRGRKGTFLAGHPLQESTRGEGGGTPLVDGAGQTGNTLNVKGGPLSTTAWMKAGDFFQVGQRLHRLDFDADTDGSGDVALEFYPSLRESPADEESIVISAPKGTFRLAANEQEMLTYNAKSDDYQLTFAAAEAI